MIKDSDSYYGTISRFFHWVVAMLLIINLFIGYLLFDGNIEDIQKDSCYIWHKNIGITIFFLTILRIGWRVVNKMPILEASNANWQRVIAKINICLMYIITLLLTISGIVMVSFKIGDVYYFDFLLVKSNINKYEDINNSISTIHIVCAAIILLSVTLHSCAAIYHHFILKDRTLKKILFPHKNDD